MCYYNVHEYIEDMVRSMEIHSEANFSDDLYDDFVEDYRENSGNSIWQSPKFGVYIKYINTVIFSLLYYLFLFIMWTCKLVFALHPSHYRHYTGQPRWKKVTIWQRLSFKDIENMIFNYLLFIKYPVGFKIHSLHCIIFKVHIVGVSEWKRTWKRNVKRLFIVQQLMGLNEWIRSVWTQMKYFIGRFLLKGIIPESYWQSIPQNNLFNRRYES